MDAIVTPKLKPKTPLEKQNILLDVEKAFNNRRRLELRGIPPHLKPNDIARIMLQNLKYEVIYRAEDGRVHILFASPQQAAKALLEFKGKDFNDVPMFVCYSQSVFLLCLVNLPYDYTVDQLRVVVQQFGKIERIFIVHCETTGQSKGYGFVEFVQKTAADEACKSLNLTVNDRKVHISHANYGIFEYRHVHSMTLVVENLSSDVTNETLKKLFESCGKISFCKIDDDKAPGYALVDFLSSRDAEAAWLKYDGWELNGKPICVSFFPPARTGASCIGGEINKIPQLKNVPVPLYQERYNGWPCNRLSKNTEEQKSTLLTSSTANEVPLQSSSASTPKTSESRDSATVIQKESEKNNTENTSFENTENLSVQKDILQDTAKKPQSPEDTKDGTVSEDLVNAKQDKTDSGVAVTFAKSLTAVASKKSVAKTEVTQNLIEKDVSNKPSQLSNNAHAKTLAAQPPIPPLMGKLLDENEVSLIDKKQTKVIDSYQSKRNNSFNKQNFNPSNSPNITSHNKLFSVQRDTRIDKTMGKFNPSHPERNPTMDSLPPGQRQGRNNTVAGRFTSVEGSKLLDASTTSGTENKITDSPFNKPISINRGIQPLMSANVAEPNSVKELGQLTRDNPFQNPINSASDNRYLQADHLTKNQHGVPCPPWQQDLQRQTSKQFGNSIAPRHYGRVVDSIRDANKFENSPTPTPAGKQVQNAKPLMEISSLGPHDINQFGHHTSIDNSRWKPPSAQMNNFHGAQGQRSQQFQPDGEQFSKPPLYPGSRDTINQSQSQSQYPPQQQQMHSQQFVHNANQTSSSSQDFQRGPLQKPDFTRPIQGDPGMKQDTSFNSYAPSFSQTANTNSRDSFTSNNNGQQERQGPLSFNSWNNSHNTETRNWQLPGGSEHQNKLTPIQNFETSRKRPPAGYVAENDSRNNPVQESTPNKQPRWNDNLNSFNKPPDQYPASGDFNLHSNPRSNSLNDKQVSQSNSYNKPIQNPNPNNAGWNSSMPNQNLNNQISAQSPYQNHLSTTHNPQQSQFPSQVGSQPPQTNWNNPSLQPPTWNAQSPVSSDWKNKNRGQSSWNIKPNVQSNLSSSNHLRSSWEDKNVNQPKNQSQAANQPSSKTQWNNRSNQHQSMHSENFDSLPQNIQTSRQQTALNNQQLQQSRSGVQQQTVSGWSNQNLMNHQLSQQQRLQTPLNNGLKNAPPQNQFQSFQQGTSEFQKQQQQSAVLAYNNNWQGTALNHSNQQQQQQQQQQQPQQSQQRQVLSRVVPPGLNNQIGAKPLPISAVPTPNQVDTNQLAVQTLQSPYQVPAAPVGSSMANLTPEGQAAAQQYIQYYQKYYQTTMGHMAGFDLAATMAQITAYAYTYYAQYYGINNTTADQTQAVVPPTAPMLGTSQVFPAPSAFSGTSAASNSSLQGSLNVPQGQASASGLNPNLPASKINQYPNQSGSFDNQSISNQRYGSNSDVSANLNKTDLNRSTPWNQERNLQRQVNSNDYSQGNMVMARSVTNTGQQRNNLSAYNSKQNTQQLGPQFLGSHKRPNPSYDSSRQPPWQK